MFFFFFDDFTDMLKSFQPTEKTKKRARKSELAIQRFQERFPVERLRHLTLEQYLGLGNSHKGFCYWLTAGTNAVAGVLRFAQKNLGVRCSQSSGEIRFVGQVSEYQKQHPEMSTPEVFRKIVSDPLFRFVKSAGREGEEDARRVFSDSILLKLLILYYPDRYMHITNVMWLDRIIWTFKLKQSGNCLEKNRIVRQFFNSRVDVNPRVEMTDFVSLLVAYVGLGDWEASRFRDYLIAQKSFSESSVESYTLAIRDVSRRLSDEDVISKSLEKAKLQIVRQVLSSDLGWLWTDGECKKRGIWHDAIRFYLEYRDWVCSYDVSEQKQRQKAETADLVERMKRAASVSDVVCVLKDSARLHDVYWHYTILSSLLCILDDGTLRLTRGDDPAMNDQLECDRLGAKDVWARTYITSFSHLEDESVAMWSVYGTPRNEAVRLAFDRELMVQLLNAIQTQSQYYLADRMDDANKIELRREDLEIEFADILYGGNVTNDRTKPYDGYKFRDAVIKTPFFLSHALDQAEEMTGYIKSRDWSYEEETRLVVRIKQSAVTDEQQKRMHLIVKIPKDILKQVAYLSGPCMPGKLQAVFEDALCGHMELSREELRVDKSKYADRLKLRG